MKATRVWVIVESDGVAYASTGTPKDCRYEAGRSVREKEQDERDDPWGPFKEFEFGTWSVEWSITLEDAVGVALDEKVLALLPTAPERVSP